MRLKPIEYTWLCDEHYRKMCKEHGYMIPVMLIPNSAFMAGMEYQKKNGN